MRIDKVVRTMLRKQKPTVTIEIQGSPFEYSSEMNVYREFSVWVDDIVNEFLGSPEIDMIAADHGALVDDLMHPLFMDFTLTDPHGGGLIMANAGSETIRVRIPWADFMDDNRAEVLGSLYHEFTHVADQHAKTASYGVYGFDAWMGEEDEQDALKSTIMSLLNYGYTKEQIAALLWDRYEPAIRGPERRERFLNYVDMLIWDIESSGEVLLET